MSFLFGPVPSRRLGRSLGVDLIPPKTCCFDCVYCEVGPTTHLTRWRRPHETGAILGELRRYLAQGSQPPDVITLAGSGEPTLNAGLGEIIAGLKAMCAVPVAVLTNGALLHLSEVRREVALADIVLPSLDAALDATFRRINRPHPRLSLELLLSGLRAFRREYAGQIWLEVMLLKGLNDSEAELAALRREIALIAPDRLQLNTAVRPVVESWAEPLGREEMAQAAALLGPGAEVIAAFDRVPRAPQAVPDEAYLEMLARRPMTAGDLAQTLGLPLSQVEDRLTELADKGLVLTHRYRQKAYFRATARSPAEPGSGETARPDA